MGVGMMMSFHFENLRKMRFLLTSGLLDEMPS